MGLLSRVALVPRGPKMDMSEVTKVAAALSIQISRDVAPIWGVQATVSAFAAPKDVPVGYWPIYIEDPSKLPPGAGGFHTDRHHQPYAIIETGDEWSLDASHELIEMLVDPTGVRMQANPILDQAIALGYPNRQVQYIVEACDPTEDAKYAYQINGVLVSDFFTPHFYDAVKSPGVRYDFAGALTAPRTVVTNGYISWIDQVENAAMQLRNFINPRTGHLEPQVVNLSQEARFERIAREEGLRSAVDYVTPTPDYRANLTAEDRARFDARRKAVLEASVAHAAHFAEQVPTTSSAGRKTAVRRRRTRR